MSTNDTPSAGDDFLDPQPRIEDDLANSSDATSATRWTSSAGDADETTRPNAESSEITDESEDEADTTKRSSGLVQWLKELPIMLAIAFVIAVLLKSFVVQAFWIPSGSMETTLHGCPGCTGDRILVNRMSYWFSDPEPGDIIVFEAPSNWEPEVQINEPTNVFGQSWVWLKRLVGAAPPAEKDLVKRVIATGGQTVSCCDAQGRVLVDGKPLDEPYIYLDGENPSTATYNLRDFGPITVPEGRLFVMGDHRNNSADSRYHIDDQYQGTIAIDSVIGRAFVILFPFNRFTFLSSENPQTATTAMAGPASIALNTPLLSLLFVAPISGASLIRRRPEKEPCTP